MCIMLLWTRMSISSLFVQMRKYGGYIFNILRLIVVCFICGVVCLSVIRYWTSAANY